MWDKELKVLCKKFYVLFNFFKSTSDLAIWFYSDKKV